MKEPKKCPFCGVIPELNGPYTLSDKPAWDLVCVTPTCPIKPKLWEQRDANKTIETWNKRYD